MDTHEQDFKAMEKNVGDLKHDFELMKGEFQDMNMKIEKIYQKLVGDELNPEGFVQQIAKLQDEVKVLTTWKNKAVWTFSIITAACIFLGAVLDLALNALQIKK